MEFRKFFKKENDLVYCADIEGLMQLYHISYCKDEWRHFIDSSKTSLKVVLLSNGITYASLPIGYSVHLNEKYENLDLFRKKLITLNISGKFVGTLR